ncbi:hypothetical protein D0Z07_0935 [Hyphodiscus hymeniophilus]|uniref:Aminoglycoside phosphotransferase domain-containing protein n=1 Tax=Hyphodiscus hymeniophilus TaxID=353542 RepID=A0A9P6VPT5_9HELO|nr:hypothetical protein D0Z07_0935 [Hyphodiscus hymeniophilus]
MKRTRVASTASSGGCHHSCQVHSNNPEIPNGQNDAASNLSANGSQHPSSKLSLSSQNSNKRSLTSEQSSVAGSEIFRSGSSYEYSQESFETYQHKVVQLCCNLGYGVPQIERMAGGGYNRIIGLNFRTGEHRECILRLPRGGWDEEQGFETEDQVAILHYLARFDSLHVPKVLAFDSRLTNAISSQYVLQSRLRGRPLQDFFYVLPICEQLKIAGLVADLILKSESVKFDKPGRIIGQSSPSLGSDPTSHSSGIEIAGYRTSPMFDLPVVQKQSFTSFVVALLEHRRNESPNWLELAERFAEEMEKAGLVRTTDDVNVLWHWDLSASNILPTSSETAASGITAIEDSRSDGEWIISGVVDWDDVLSVPRVLARKPPSWLWLDETERPGFMGNRDTPPERNLTSDELLIQAHFNQIMERESPSYIQDAYFRGRWLRELAKFGLYGVGESLNWHTYEDFVKLWEEYYINVSKSSRHDGSDETSEESEGIGDLERDEDGRMDQESE